MTSDHGNIYIWRMTVTDHWQPLCQIYVYASLTCFPLNFMNEKNAERIEKYECGNICICLQTNRNLPVIGQMDTLHDGVHQM